MKIEMAKQKYDRKKKDKPGSANMMYMHGDTRHRRIRKQIRHASIVAAVDSRDVVWYVSASAVAAASSSTAAHRWKLCNRCDCAACNWCDCAACLLQVLQVQFSLQRDQKSVIVVDNVILVGSIVRSQIEWFVVVVVPCLDLRPC